MDEERTRPALAPTGDARVDQAIEGLSDLDQIDLDERPAVLEEVHDRLREILGELGEAGRRPRAPPARPPPGPGTRPAPARARPRPGRASVAAGSRPRYAG